MVKSFNTVAFDNATLVFSFTKILKTLSFTLFSELSFTRSIELVLSNSIELIVIESIPSETVITTCPFMCELLVRFIDFIIFQYLSLYEAKPYIKHFIPFLLKVSVIHFELLDLI